jgi:hypothetical protein
MSTIIGCPERLAGLCRIKEELKSVYKEPLEYLS